MAATFNGDKLVNKYLRYLNRGLRPLPLYRRREIMAEFKENIADARAELDPSDEPGLRALLGRIGLPSELAAEIVETEDVPKRRPIDDFVPALLLFGAILVGIGWIFGVVWLWLSKIWRLGDKLLGTLVWPFGIAGILLMPGRASYSYSGSCSSVGDAAGHTFSNCNVPSSFVISAPWRGAYILLAFGAPIAVFVRLTWISIRGYAKEEPVHRWRHAGTWFSVGLPVALFIGAVTLQVNIYERSGNYGQPAFEPKWQAAMTEALVQAGPPKWGCQAPPASVHFLAGFGTVDQICVVPTGDGHGEQFRFLQGNPVSTGLLFAPRASDAKAQAGFCVRPISGPWWDLAVVNPNTGHCPDGFISDPAS